MDDSSSSAADSTDGGSTDREPTTDRPGGTAEATDDGPDERTAENDSHRRESNSGTESNSETESTSDELESLRAEVEAKYDFDNFGPADMAKMSPEEWDAVFDPDSWIVGDVLLDRVEDELKNRIASREVFAVLERIEEDGESRILAYSDEGYAIVYPDGTVEGSGTVLRDVEPSVALCSMEDYEVAEPPSNFELPGPEEVVEGSGQLGNKLLQVVAVAQLVAGIGLAAIWGFTDWIPTGPRGTLNIVPPTAALFFVVTGLFLFAVVANARLSDRFRAEEYRNRLRAMSGDGGARPEFLPPPSDAAEAPSPPFTDTSDGDANGR
ncbi:MAG: DUF7319 domain-containing protein [Halobacteriota archaeon]